MENILTEKANLIAGDLEKKLGKEISFDLLTIAAILSIIVSVIRLVMYCSEDKRDASEILSNPSWFQRFRLSRIIKRAFSQHPKGHLIIDEVWEPLLTRGKNLTQEEISELFKEVKYKCSEK